MGEQRWRRLLLAFVFVLTLLLYLCLLGPQLKVVCDQACLASVVVKKAQLDRTDEKARGPPMTRMDEMGDVIPPRASTTLRIPVACRGVFAESRNRQVYAAVPFRIMHVRIVFHVKKLCSVISSFIDKSYNFSVGIGLNEFEIRLTDSSMLNDEVRYHFKVYRRHRVSFPIEGRSTKMKAFRFKQDCDFLFDGQQDCGLSQMKEFPSWACYLRSRSKLPYCPVLQLHKRDGFWALPCSDDGARCSWGSAEWHVAGCRLRTLHPNACRRLMVGKTVVFLGDSTLRGIMYSMVEKLNGSIRFWRKAHGALALNNINRDGRTTFLFNYFPPFEKGKQITSICAALQYHENQLKFQSNRIVVIVGGVQWLTTTILENLKNCLNRMKMDVPIVVKGIGSGFFLPMKNLKFTPLITQQCLIRQDQKLADTSQRLGFIYLPTFNMTWSRFRDFHPGKCACHFHTVKKTENGDHKIAGVVHNSYVNLLWNILYSID